MLVHDTRFNDLNDSCTNYANMHLYVDINRDIKEVKNQAYIQGPSFLSDENKPDQRRKKLQFLKIVVFSFEIFR